MADTYKMGSISPIEPNPLLDKTSQGLATLKKFLNRDALYYNNGQPQGRYGDLLLGNSPEEINKWAYGFHPFNDPKDWARTGPIQEQRQSGVADVAMLPLAETATAAELAAKGLGALGRRAVAGTADLGRRQFLKNAGTATTGVAVAAPLLLRNLGKDVEKAGASAAEKDLAKTAGKATTHATPEEFHAAMEKAHEDALREFDEGRYGPIQQSMDAEMDTPKAYEHSNKEVQRFREKYGEDTFRDRWHKLAYDLGGAPEISQDDLYHMNLLEDRLHAIRQDPRFAPYKDYAVPDGHYELGADRITPADSFTTHKRGGAIERTTHDRKIL